MAALLWTSQETVLMRIYTQTYIYVYTYLKKSTLKTKQNKTKQNGAYITPRWPQAFDFCSLCLCSMAVP